VTNATAAHIHDGTVGTNGPIIVPLVAGASGSWSVPANSFLSLDQVIKFQNGGLYVNIHTASNPGGEIRGQIGMLVKQARLTGALDDYYASPVSVDGKVYIETQDAHIAGPGAVGVWTKADSVTAFDDFSYGPAQAAKK